jgi:hypothetical protein
MSFIMPTDKALGAMSCDEIENLRIDAEKAANEIALQISNLSLERNELKRQDLMLADGINKARVNLRDVKLCADRLKSLFFQKRI